MPETASLPVRVRPVSAKNTELPASSQTKLQLKKSKDLQKLMKEYDISVMQYEAIRLRMSGMNQYQAALGAGYTESVAHCAGMEIFRKQNVRAFIKRLVKDLVGLEGFTPEEILRDLEVLSEANIMDYVEIDEEGRPKVDFRRIDRVMGYAIEGFSYDENGRLQLQLANRMRALEMKARIAKMFDREVGQAGEDGGPLTIQALDEIRQKYENHITTVTVNNITVNNGPQEPKKLHGETIDAVDTEEKEEV